MGLFDIFRRRPAWQRSWDNAMEEIGSSADPELILRVVKETEFEAVEAEELGLKAADRLWELRKGDPGAKEALMRLAREASNPVCRCHAANYLRNREDMSHLISENVAGAYALLEPDSRQRPRDAAEWIECAGDEATLVAAFEAACQRGDFRHELYSHIRGQGVLSALFWRTKGLGGHIREELVDHIRGSAAEYERIAGEAEDARCVTAAIGHLNADSPALRKQAEAGHNGAYRRLMQLGREDMIAALADGGSLAALKYLAYTKKSKYGKRYESQMRDDLRDRAMAADPNSFDGANLIGNAVKQGVLPEEKLEEIALTWRLSGTSSVPWIAMRQIKDPERLFRLLLERKSEVGSSNSRQEWNALGEELVGKLSNREDLLLRCLLETGYDGGVQGKALKLIEDPEKLMQLAMSDHSMAPEAAQRLPKSKLAPVRNSKNPKAAKLGLAQHCRNRVARAEEAELRQIMAWNLENSDTPDTYLKALERVTGQETLLEALRAWLDSSRRFSADWKGVGEALLGRITDGPGLLRVYLERKGQMEAWEIAWLKALIQGTDEEARFTDAARQYLMDSPEEWGRYARWLRLYHDLPDDWQALWRFGGQEFVWKVLTALGREKEYGRAYRLGGLLAGIYKNVPESRGAPLEPAKGRRYTKHVDIVASCASESEDHDEVYVLELD